MQQPNDPTPEEIRKACLKIQGEWTPEQKQRRLRYDWRSVADNQTPVQPQKAKGREDLHA